ncbi:FAM63A isoform X1 [Brachionus plicatilis]|uniref:Ubiquitin carboxyl-terminal hydrolase n=1 Tax=Brachionus plicatilis TaxID=10195 RepID=A0A3M7QR47_BRAPC|nr:FAM63A isoform X1 [Brachionus plicatilis]
MSTKELENQHSASLSDTVNSILEEIIDKIVDSNEKSETASVEKNDIATKIDTLNLNDYSNPLKSDENLAISSVKTENNLFAIKWISFFGRKVPIVLQNINGPCPLISICNVLLLRDQMHLANNIEVISNEILIQKLADLLFNEFVPRLQENASKSVINFEQIISDSLTIFEKLQYGLDVNVKFTGVSDFEYTREMDIFDIFAISLYHGWLIDPEQTEFYQYLADKSYNQLVEISINGNENSDTEKATLKLLAEDFLKSTASQLTYYGLSALHSILKPHELSILFRNNHFSTIYKHSKNNRLFTLVTDSGYLNHDDIVWETLDNIEGAGHFCDSDFKFSEAVSNAPDSSRQNPHENDYLLALSLQQQEEAAHQQETQRSLPQESPARSSQRQSPKKKDKLKIKNFQIKI